MMTHIAFALLENSDIEFLDLLLAGKVTLCHFFFSFHNFAVSHKRRVFCLFFLSTDHDEKKLLNSPLIWTIPSSPNKSDLATYDAVLISFLSTFMETFFM